MNAPRRTQEERRESTREALLAAAVGLFAERGVESATLQDVSDRAGLSKGALTHHFDSKDSLVDAVLDRCGSVLERAATAAWDPTASPLPRLKKALGAVSSLGDAHPAELRVFVALSLAAAHDARLASLARPRVEALERVLADGLTLTLAELGVRARVSPEAVARALVSSALGRAARLEGAADAAEAVEARRFWELCLVALLDPFDP